jgi:hypothetical protein
MKGRTMRQLSFLLVLLVCHPVFGDLPKTDIPAAEITEAAMSLLHETFSADYKNLKTAEDRKAFAQKLIDLSVKTADDPVARYIMLREALSQAVDAGAIDIVQDAVTKLSAQYAVNPNIEIAGAWKQIIKKSRPHDVYMSIAEDSLRRLDRAASAGEFADAKMLSTIAVDASRKARDSSLVKLAVERGKALASEAQEWDFYQKALATLKRSPTDKPAHLIVGRQLGTRNDWQTAFPHLAQSDDSVLSSLGAESSKTIVEPSAISALADAWWKAGDSARPKDRQWYRSAAVFWYRQAVASLTGLAKVKAEERIAEVAPPRERTGAEAVPFDERRYAEAMLKIGAGVSVKTATEEFDVHPDAGRFGDLMQARKELPSEPFSITRVLLKRLKTMDGTHFECLALIPTLRSVMLESSPATDDDVRLISLSQTVENIALNDTQVTDKCLPYLRGRKLTRLFLRRAKVTDAAIPELLTMQIHVLDLYETQVSKAGIQKLRAAAPHTTIVVSDKSASTSPPSPLVAQMLPPASLALLFTGKATDYIDTGIKHAANEPIRLTIAIIPRATQLQAVATTGYKHGFQIKMMSGKWICDVFSKQRWTTTASEEMVKSGELHIIEFSFTPATKTVSFSVNGKQQSLVLDEYVPSDLDLLIGSRVGEDGKVGHLVLHAAITHFVVEKSGKIVFRFDGADARNNVSPPGAQIVGDIVRPTQ